MNYILRQLGFLNMKNKLVTLLRQFRVLHRWVGVPLSIFFLVIAITGLLLGWKKNSETLQPRTLSGKDKDVSKWISFEEVQVRSNFAVDSLSIEAGEVDRLDVRMDKALAKVLFKEGYWEVQVDLSTGKILSIAQRHSDWIEHLHDGSIITEAFKIGYTSVVAIGLIGLALSGLYLWYGPKIVRRSKL